MNIRMLFIILILPFTLFLPGTASTAHSSSAQLIATARIMPWASLKAERHVSEYVVTDTDIARGYVIVRSAATLHIRTNASRQVTVRPMAADNSRIFLVGPGESCEPCLNIDIAAGPSIKNIKKTVDYRINLPGEIKSGRYQLNAALDIESY